MKRIPLDEAIEQVVEEYRAWLEDDPRHVAEQWQHFLDQHAQVANEGDDVFLDIEQEDDEGDFKQTL